MRTFIAIEISGQIKEVLTQVESHLKYAGADVKWVRPDIIHLTLKFLGEITEKRAEEVIQALGPVARTTGPFDLTIKDIGAFPKIDHPRVIWVGLEKGAAESAELALKVDEALSGIGFQKEERPFSPHITIGRVRSAQNRAKLADKMSSAAASCQLSSVSPHRVSSVTLFRSTLTPQGPIYTKIHEAKFLQ